MIFLALRGVFALLSPAFGGPGGAWARLLEEDEGDGEDLEEDEEEDALLLLERERPRDLRVPVMFPTDYKRSMYNMSYRGTIVGQVGDVRR